jgi:glycerol uptake facilitator-like aquaporin
VSLIMVFEEGMRPAEFARYVAAQIAGAFVGVASANVMFGLPPLFMSQHVRVGGAQMFSEFIATFGLLIVILLGVRFKPAAVAHLVAAYITAAYWFTASTSFANPAVTLARAFTDTFAGIRLADAPLFVVAQIIGAAAALFVFRLLRKEPA